MQAAAGNLKKVTLELGGKSPQVLFEDADLDVAIPGAANGIFFNQGQCCNAGSRLYVERDVYDEVVEGIADEARKIKVGPGVDPDTQMGPLISAEQRDKVLGYMSSGADAGASAPAGGGRVGDRGYFVEPTVLTDTTPDMKVVREEIFGPVVCAIPFEPRSTTSSRSGNDTSFGLARGSGRATSTRRTGPPTACAPARCGSTATTCSTPRCRSAATRSRAGAGRWATTRSRTTSRPSPWSPSSHSGLTVRWRGGAPPDPHHSRQTA